MEMLYTSYFYQDHEFDQRGVVQGPSRVHLAGLQQSPLDFLFVYGRHVPRFSRRSAPTLDWTAGDLSETMILVRA
jgi:hypothetical protein